MNCKPGDLAVIVHADLDQRHEAWTRSTFSPRWDAGTPLTDASREEAIHQAGELLQAAMTRQEAARRRYGESSCLTDKADMDAAGLQAQAALRCMEALIKGRSQAQVDRMERERGLA